MTEDTNWLKKNPRMSLWKSNRFYGQDLDTSVMVHDEKSKNDILVVPHVPRRSNVPIEKIKQMDFKFPAPVSKNRGVKKPISGVSKVSIPHISVSRQSMNLRPRNNEAGIEKQDVVKPKQWPSTSSTFGRANHPGSKTGNISPAKSNMVQGTPMITDKINQYCVTSSADLSLLSQSKVVNQSTPNETAVIRSILKNNRCNGKKCARNLLDGKMSSAVKRVNFNGNLKDKREEKGKETEGSIVQNEESTNAEIFYQQKKKDVITESKEESIAAFSNSFKPIFDDNLEENKENIEEAKDDVEGCVAKSEEIKKSEEVNNESSESSVPGKFISDLMDMWKIYRSNVGDIRNELESIDENFQRTLKSVSKSEIEEKLYAYEEEKANLYKQLKDLETEFQDKVRNSTQVKTLFLKYTQRKRNILGLQSQLEEKFEKYLRTVGRKYMEEPGFTTGKNGNEDISSATDCHNLKTVKRISSGKRKSWSTTDVEARATPPKRSCLKNEISGGSTPENTPARRRELSRKIEKQIRNLFEE